MSALAQRTRLLSALRTLTCAGFAIAAAVLPACSSDPVSAAPVTCDDAKCAPGNKCLPYGTEPLKCRKTCSSNSEAATSCPFGYTCTDTGEGVEPFCVKDRATFDGKPLTKKDTGQWGAACQATLGVTNPGCDGDQGFFCYGISPTDGSAYCTRYDCEADEECGAGFWCATINKAPNVASTKRSAPGEVQKVCLRRAYCATCKVDLDCPPILGTPQHCMADEAGTTFCAPECAQSNNCPNEAKCVDAGFDAKVCYPRSRLCVGDGSLCSPCRSDVDCGEDGMCVKGQYTTEKTCAKKSTTSCEAGTARGSCAETAASGVRVACLGGRIDDVPADYCHGFYQIGSDSGDIGCYTPKR